MTLKDIKFSQTSFCSSCCISCCSKSCHACQTVKRMYIIKQSYNTVVVDGTEVLAVQSKNTPSFTCLSSAERCPTMLRMTDVGINDAPPVVLVTVETELGSWLPGDIPALAAILLYTHAHKQTTMFM